MGILSTMPFLNHGDFEYYAIFWTMGILSTMPFLNHVDFEHVGFECLPL